MFSWEPFQQYYNGRGFDQIEYDTHRKINKEVKEKEIKRQRDQLQTFTWRGEQQINRIQDDHQQFKMQVKKETISELSKKVESHKLYDRSLQEDYKIEDFQKFQKDLEYFAAILGHDKWDQIEMQKIYEKTQCLKAFIRSEQQQRIFLTKIDQNIQERSRLHIKFIESLKELKEQRIQMIVSKYNKFDEQITNMLKLNKLSRYEQFDRYQSGKFQFKMRYGIRINDFLEKLVGTEYLRSTNIDFFTNYIMEKQRQMQFENGVDHLVTSTSFWETYHPGSISGIDVNLYTDQKISINQMKFQSNKAYLTDFKSICCPLNITNTHWVMVQYKNNQLINIDSLNGLFTAQSKDLNIYLQGLHELIRKDNPNCGTMVEQKEKSPQQENGYDCGVFVIFNFFCKVKGVQLDKIISNYRKRLYYMMLIIETSPKDQQLDILLLDYIEGLKMQFRSIYF